MEFQVAGCCFFRADFCFLDFGGGLAPAIARFLALVLGGLTIVPSVVAIGNLAAVGGVDKGRNDHRNSKGTIVVNGIDGNSTILERFAPYCWPQYLRNQEAVRNQKNTTMILNYNDN